MVISAPELGAKLLKTEPAVPCVRVAACRKGGKRQVGRQLSLLPGGLGASWLLPVAYEMSISITKLNKHWFGFLFTHIEDQASILKSPVKLLQTYQTLDEQ